MLHERMRKVVTEDAAVMLAHLRLNPQIPITSDKIQAMWDKVTRKAVAEARQRGLDRIPSHGCHHEHGAGIPLTDQPGEGLSKPSGTEENDNSEREQNATHENGQAPKELTPNKRTEHARHQAFWRAMILAEISPKGGARDSSHMGAPGVVLENRKPSSKSRIRQRVKKARLRQPSSPAAGTDSERSPQGCTTEKVSLASIYPEHIMFCSDQVLLTGIQDNDLSTNGLRLGQPKRPVGSGCRASPSSERQGVLPGINAQGRQDRSRSPFSVERPDWLSKAGSAVEQNAWLLGTAAVGVGTVARDAIGRMFKPGMAGGWR